ncbi:phosphatase PAP2 family protein [Aeromicrobium sp.]|uniref:phosphatase PAP2 family protein n=1 Tax=Aeromicrobium sp. TaxID=1871063 RepID=UPI003C61A8DE
MHRRPYTFAVCLSVTVGLAAIIASQRYDVPLRDPDGFLGPAYLRLPLIGLLFFAAGIVPPAFNRSRRLFTQTAQWRRSLHYSSSLGSRLLDGFVTTFFWGLIAGIIAIAWTAAGGSVIGRVLVALLALAAVGPFALHELRSQIRTGMTTISRLTEIVVLDESTLRPLTWGRAISRQVLRIVLPLFLVSSVATGLHPQIGDWAWLGILAIPLWLTTNGADRVVAARRFEAGHVPSDLGPLRALDQTPQLFQFMDIIRAEWTWKRVRYIALGLISFYVCYVSYRNLKSDLPLAREGVHFDKQMLDIDYFLFFNHNPAPVLHDLLGVGFTAQVLSVIYVAYLPLIPLSLGAFLVWGKDLSLGAWYATALSLNWVLGVISYYIFPTFGPAFVQPAMFANLPDTSAAQLQGSLFRAATRFYEDPTGGTTYGIAGFASLHVSVVVSAALFLRATNQRKIVQLIGWVYLGLVVLATIYFGWHYLADDVAGAFIGWIAVVIGAWATGNTKRQRRKAHAAPIVAPPPLEPRPAV